MEETVEVNSEQHDTKGLVGWGSKQKHELRS